MLYSNDINNFGRNIKKIRERLRLSLYDVSDKTGLKRQTISNIERGNCIPRIDTLDILSNVYKVNIYKMFDESRKVHEFALLYKKLDQIITTLDLSNLDNICNDIRDFVSINIEKKNNNINKYELESINYFIEFINKVYRSKEISQTEILEILKHLEINDINHLTNDYLNNRLFTFIEYRLLMVLSMLLIQSKNHDEGLTLLHHCLDNISNFVFDEVSELHLKLKINLNISYLNYLKQDYVNSLEYASKGINLATTNHSTYLLSQLLARKAVAELKLEFSQEIIEEDYLKSIALFYINDNKSLANDYIKIFEKHHHLNSDILDHLKKYIVK